MSVVIFLKSDGTGKRCYGSDAAFVYYEVNCEKIMAMTELFMDIVRVSLVTVCSRMEEQMFERLEDLVRRLEELNIELTDPDTIINQEKYRQLMERAERTCYPIVEKYLDIRKQKRGVKTVSFFWKKKMMKRCVSLQKKS